METLTLRDLDIAGAEARGRDRRRMPSPGRGHAPVTADDIFVRIERELDDTEGQLIASVLSKKISAGATHVVIDIPVGPTAKVRSKEAVQHLAACLVETAAQSGWFCAASSAMASASGCGIGAPGSTGCAGGAAVLDDAPWTCSERAASVVGAVLGIGWGCN